VGADCASQKLVLAAFVPAVARAGSRLGDAELRVIRLGLSAEHGVKDLSTI